MDGKIYVTLYNLFDQSGMQWETNVFNQHKVFGFLVDTGSCSIIGDPYEVTQVTKPEQHITLFHELNHARVLLKSLYDNKYEWLTRTTISDNNGGTLQAPLRDTSTNTIIPDIFGGLSSGMEEFQNIGITAGSFAVLDPDTKIIRTKNWRWEDPINECSYRLANAKAENLAVCIIRYPYITSSLSVKMNFINQECKQRILKKYVTI